MKIVTQVVPISGLRILLVAIALLLSVILHHAVMSAMPPFTMSTAVPIAVASSGAVAATSGVVASSHVRGSDGVCPLSQAAMPTRLDHGSARPALSGTGPTRHGPPAQTTMPGARSAAIRATNRVRPPTVRRALLQIFLL